jgi:hypothetical protein
MGRRFVDYIFRVAGLEFTYGVCGLLILDECHRLRGSEIIRAYTSAAVTLLARL